MKLRIVTAIVAGLIHPSIAIASPTDDNYHEYQPSVINAGWQEERALEIARIVWHHPCVDRMTIVWIQPTGELSQADGYASERNCTLRLVSRPMSWADFAQIVLHEAGHLAHYRDVTNTADPLHSSNPNSIMASPMRIRDPRIKDRGRPFLVRHGAL